MSGSPGRSRASLVMRSAGAAARHNHSPRTGSPPSSQPPASRGALAAASNRKRKPSIGAADKKIAGLLFQGGLRRSVAAALRWADVRKAADGRGLLLTVRRSKTDQEGTVADVRYLKNGAAASVWAIRPPAPADDASVLGSLIGQSIARRLAAAVRSAGIEGRITGQSGRVGSKSDRVRPVHRFNFPRLATVLVTAVVVFAACAQGPGTAGPRGPSDTAPTFAGTIADQSYTVEEAISPLTLPEASGGNGTLSYSLTPTVPGLTFAAATHTLSGTPTSVGSYDMTYLAVDGDDNTAASDAATLTFTITVQPAATLYVGCSADAETWRGLRVCSERPRDGYDRDSFGTGYSTLEDDIIAALPPTMIGEWTGLYALLLHRIRYHAERDRCH